VPGPPEGTGAARVAVPATPPRPPAPPPGFVLESPETDRGGFLAKAGTAGAGLSQATLDLSESLWRTPEMAKRVAGGVAELNERIGVPPVLNMARGVENALRPVAEGWSVGDARVPGWSDIANRIDESQQFLTREFEPFRRLQEKGIAADRAIDAAMRGDLKPLRQVLTDPEAWAAFGAQSVPSLYAAYASGGSVPFMAWLEAMEQAGNASEFERRTGQKISDSDYAAAVTAQAAINAWLEKLGLEAVLGKAPGGKTLLGRIIGGAVGEAGTEAAQQFTGNVAQRAYDPDANLTAGILPAAMGGGVAGGAGAGASHVAERAAARPTLPSPPPGFVLQESAGGVAPVGSTTPQNQRPTIVAMVPEERLRLRFDAPELNDYAALVEARHGLPPGTLNALKNAGERSNSDQVSPAGARGVMQFMPATWAAYGEGDITDPVASIDAAGRYMADLIQQYDGNLLAAVAHYNGGGRAGNAVLNGEAPPAAETRGYLARVAAAIGMAAQSSPADIAAPAPPAARADTGRPADGASPSTDRPPAAAATVTARQLAAERTDAVPRMPEEGVAAMISTIDARQPPDFRSAPTAPLPPTDANVTSHASIDPGRARVQRTEPAAPPAMRPPPPPPPGFVLETPQAAPVARSQVEVRSGAVNMPGSQYTGMIELGTASPANVGTRPSVAARAQIVTRESVLKPFLQALGVPLYQGRVRGKKVLGFYRPKTEAVRIKKHSDLEVAAHELAHLIDDRLFNGFRADKTKPVTRPWARGPKAQIYANELKSVSYDQGKVYEGWAEYVRLWMTQPQDAATKAPELTKWMDAWVRSPENPYGPAILQAREGMLTWYAQSGRDRLLSKIGPQEQLNDILTGVREEARQSIVDNLQGILSMELDLAGEQTPLGPYETARLTRGSYAIVDGAIRYGAPVIQPDGSIKFEGKGLEQILQPVADRLEDFIAYAVSTSAAELKAQGRERLFTDAEIEAGLALKSPEFERAFEEYQAWNGRIVTFAVEKGLISDRQRGMWRRQAYLPFYRVSQPSKRLRRAGIEGNVTVTKALTGGTGNLRDILGNVVQNASNLITEALRNEARVRIVDFAKKLRGGGKWITPIPKGSRPVSISTEQIRAAVYNMLGIDRRALNAGLVPEEVLQLAVMMERAFAMQPAYQQFWQHGQAPKVRGGDQVIAVLRDGEPEFYEVSDPLLFRSIQALNPRQQHVIQRVLNAGRRVMQGSITLSLDFMAANIWRDTLHAWAFSGHGFKPVIDSIRGMKSRLTSDATYRDFIANGGGMASYLLDEGALRRHLEKFYTRKGINYRTVIDTPAKLLYALETLSESFEVASRLGEFRRAQAAGESPRRAAYAAREITTDFAMRGDAEFAQWFYDSVPFLKAAVNSIDRAYRGFTKDPHHGVIWAKTGLIALFSVLLYLWNRDDELYQELEDWDKDGHWHVILRPPGGAPIHLRFPKIWEIGAMASAAERSMEAFLNAQAQGASAVGDYGKHLWRILKEQMSFDFVPGLLEPLYEVYALNRNRFTGREIENMGMRQRLPFARYSEYTSRSMAGLGELTKDLPPALQISPARAEALVRGYFNTWGMYGLALLDRTLYGDQLPEAKADQIPGIRRFVRSHPARTQAETDFWNLYDELKQLHNTANFMEKWRPAVGVELDEQAAMRNYDAVHQVGELVKDIGQQMSEVYRSADYTPEEKRQMVDELQRQKNAVLGEFMRAMRQSPP